MKRICTYAITDVTSQSPFSSLLELLEWTGNGWQVFVDAYILYSTHLGEVLSDELDPAIG